MSTSVDGKYEALKLRTKMFALRVIKLVRALPKNEEGRVIGKQILRSAASVGANYRAVCRARSRAEFIAKVGIVLEETDETAFWLELIMEAGLIARNKITALHTEAEELTKIFGASFYTARRAEAPST